MLLRSTHGECLPPFGMLTTVCFAQSLSEYDYSGGRQFTSFFEVFDYEGIVGSSSGEFSVSVWL
jgi:hypothetical protein